MAMIPSTPIFRRTDEIFVVSLLGKMELGSDREIFENIARIHSANFACVNI